jgi:uncharacterized membrane protein
LEVAITLHVVGLLLCLVKLMQSHVNMSAQLLKFTIIEQCNLIQFHGVNYFEIPRRTLTEYGEI